MTPATYLAAARDIVILVAIGILLWLVYRGGEDRVRAADLKGLQKQIEQQSKTLSVWRKESTDAQETLSKDVAAINRAAATPVVHDWVRQPSCPQPAVLSAAAPQARPQPSAAGGIRPGSGAVSDGPRRDRVVAQFKQRWELVLAGCRALDAQWPQP